MSLLIGCSKVTVVEGTTQKRAMQIVIALYKQGLSANTVREAGGQGKYRVEIDQRSYAQALAAIEREGLLDEPAPSFEELTASSSFFPASREVEALRLDYALGLEIKRILEELPGVDHAQVLVRKRFGSREESAPSVSIVLRTESGTSVPESTVIEMARRSVPGLDAERVFISAEQVKDGRTGAGVNGILNEAGKVSYTPLVPFVFKWRVPKDDYTGFAILFLTCIFAIGALSLVLGYAIGQMRVSRRAQPGDGPEIGQGTARLERQKRDLLEG